MDVFGGCLAKCRAQWMCSVQMLTLGRSMHWQGWCFGSAWDSQFFCAFCSQHSNDCMQREGQSHILCMREPCCFLRQCFSDVLKAWPSFGSLSLWDAALSSGQLLQERVCQLPVLLARRYKYHSPFPLRHTDCFLQLKAVGCLQANVALATSVTNEFTFYHEQTELCSSRRHQLLCRNWRLYSLN